MHGTPRFSEVADARWLPSRSEKEIPTPFFSGSCRSIGHTTVSHPGPRDCKARSLGNPLELEMRGSGRGRGRRQVLSLPNWRSSPE